MQAGDKPYVEKRKNVMGSECRDSHCRVVHVRKMLLHPPLLLQLFCNSLKQNLIIIIFCTKQITGIHDIYR